MVFAKNSLMYASFELIYDADGKVWLEAQAHDTLVAKTPYGIIANEYGPISQALPAANKYIMVGVPEAAWAADDIAKFQVGGYIADMITASLAVTAGHGLTINTGAVADIGADYTGAAGEFAVCVTTTSSSQATQTVILVPHIIITI